MGIFASNCCGKDESNPIICDLINLIKKNTLNIINYDTTLQNFAQEKLNTSQKDLLFELDKYEDLNFEEENIKPSLNNSLNSILKIIKSVFTSESSFSRLIDKIVPTQDLEMIHESFDLEKTNKNKFYNTQIQVIMIMMFTISIISPSNNNTKDKGEIIYSVLKSFYEKKSILSSNDIYNYEVQADKINSIPILKKLNSEVANKTVKFNSPIISRKTNNSSQNQVLFNNNSRNEKSSLKNIETTNSFNNNSSNKVSNTTNIKSNFYNKNQNDKSKHDFSNYSLLKITPSIIDYDNNDNLNKLKSTKNFYLQTEFDMIVIKKFFFFYSQITVINILSRLVNFSIKTMMAQINDKKLEKDMLLFNKIIINKETLSYLLATKEKFNYSNSKLFYQHLMTVFNYKLKESGNRDFKKAFISLENLFNLESVAEFCLSSKNTRK